ncbi:RdgB/HAM1 family non-canonical purine NTP pyrophosphatase [Microlunatus sp. Y2014]|uniref:RdgB/HAM1 family non-canonical purine NTP pyrophosphatase n=1 Tax=Microlunatus sp. Y2014 TaxID=3418488 RepID=UPI003DA71A23
MTAEQPTVVLATHNAKKLIELRRVMAAAAPGVRVLGLADVAPYPEPAETESTFAGNAILKATACTAATGLPALADDSGIEVDVLNRMPGVRSARWAGPEGDDAANNALLLRQLADVPDERRTARFRCAMAFVRPGAEPVVREGTMEGAVVTEPAGRGGFGYDPLFRPAGETVTTAELSPERKDQMSHRGKAVREIVPVVVEAMTGEHSEGQA